MNTLTTTDWLIVVGALAAAVTAIATAANAFLLWLQNRRSAAFEKPIVEEAHPHREGDTSVFAVTFKDTQPATLVLESIAIRRPRRFKILRRGRSQQQLSSWDRQGRIPAPHEAALSLPHGRWLARLADSPGGVGTHHGIARRL
jgi:hypothetical protein